MDDELKKMEKYDVWDVVDRKPGYGVVGGKWVYSKKIDGDTGKYAAYKARFVAKGYRQIESIDFTEVHASVAHKDSIRIILAIVCYFDLECDQVDIVAAVLNGELEEEIYMDPPEGSNIPSNKLLRLKRSIYGLKQSPRCFNQALDKWLQSQGLVPLDADPCVYIRRRGSEVLMLTVHVDDQLICCNNKDSLAQFKAELHKQFECKDLGPANYFLGFNIIRDRAQHKLFISQEHYLEALLEKNNMSDANPAKNVMPTGY